MSRTTKYSGRPRPSMLNLRGRKRTVASILRDAARPRRVKAAA